VAAAVMGMFERGEVDKRYLALVRGEPPQGGVIDHAIPRSEGGPRVPSLTRYLCLARSPVDRCSLVLAKPETGRLHQVRRHMCHVHHPIVGDVNHGDGAVNRHYRARYGLHRLASHAVTIAFDHPVTGARIDVRAPVPDDLAPALAALGLSFSEEDLQREMPA
jgi:tRNA pseudouridine65 synthase